MMTKHVDTYMHIIGSGALSWTYWSVGTMQPADWTLPDSAYGGWEVNLFELDPDTGEVIGEEYVINHNVIMRALRHIIADTTFCYDLRAECWNLIYEPDDADFDAISADWVLQIAAFGEIRY